MKISLQIFIALIICLNLVRAAYCTNESITVSQRTNQAALLNNQGVQLRKENKLQESRAILEQACLLDPNLNSSIVHENLALTVKQLGELNLACVEFAKALQFAPDRSTILFNMASCYSQMGEINQAISILQNYLSKYPNDEKADSAKRMLLSLQNTPSLRDNPSADDYLPGAMTTSNKMPRWSSDKQPIQVYIESGKKVDGYQPEFKEVLISAFDQWINVVQPRLSWKLTSKKRKANIICSWTEDRKNFQQPNSAELGETRLKYLLNSICEIISAKMVLSTMNFQNTEAMTAEQMKNLCLHEVGHALGISGHSSNHNDVMFLMTKENPTVQLSNRDKTTLARLYSLPANSIYQSRYPNQPTNPIRNTYPSAYTGNYQNTSLGNYAGKNQTSDKNEPF